jgi:hypothetical protein
VGKLFSDRPPERGDRILYPGLGAGPFVSAVLNYCGDRDLPVPKGVGVENDPRLVRESRETHEGGHLEIEERDFLKTMSDLGEFEYVVGNPPYVAIEDLAEEEKSRYRADFKTAKGRFDLYLLFFEQALGRLAPGGRLSFVTPEKFEYTLTAEPLRELLTSKHHVVEIDHVNEDAFEGLTTYPTITTVDHASPGRTRIVQRDGTAHEVNLPRDGSSWAHAVRGADELEGEHSLALADVCQRISCGLATGADKVFVQPAEDVPDGLLDETYPTISGRQLSVRDGVEPTDRIICPYEPDGRLTPETELGSLEDWARLHEKRLRERSCVKKGGKAWYAWHENPPFDDVLKPKILCQDLAQEPRFWADRKGGVLPRHSVYYLVPKREDWLGPLLEYLNGPRARAWIEGHAQHAANGSIRLQSTVLKKVPVPDDLVSARVQSTIS